MAKGVLAARSTSQAPRYGRSDSSTIWLRQLHDLVDNVAGEIAGDYRMGAVPPCRTIAGQSESFITDKALEALSRLFTLSKKDLEAQLEAACWHDWQKDPFALGAYSYVNVGGDGAQETLAMPIEDSLFFAGEATDFSGHHGTVHGAIASGARAVKEILNQPGREKA